MFQFMTAGNEQQAFYERMMKENSNWAGAAWQAGGEPQALPAAGEHTMPHIQLTN